MTYVKGINTLQEAISNVLHVLGSLVALEPRQADLLNRICDGRLLSADSLRAKGAFDATSTGRGGGADERQGDFLDEAEA